MTQIWGHRGASFDAPENTLPAFALAFEQGAEGIELDVHLTRDDEVVVIHDESLERTTDGSGWVADHTLAQLRRLNAGKPKGLTGVEIPLLAEVLALAKDAGGIVNVELKTDLIAYQGIEERVLELVAEAGMDEHVLFSSFNHYTLMRLRSAGATQPLGALLQDRLYKPWRYVDHLGVEAIHPNQRACSGKVVRKCHERGIAVNVWTVDGESDITAQLEHGVDAIITNRPDRAIALRAQI